MLLALQCMSLFTALVTSSPKMADFEVIEQKGPAYIRRTYSIPYVEQLPGVIDARLNNGRIKMVDTMKKGGVFLFIDVNNLNKINKLFNRTTGDAYIISVISEIQKLIGENAEVYRLGGDEFAIILPNIPNKAKITPIEVQELLQQIERAVAKNSQAVLKPAIQFKGQVLQMLKDDRFPYMNQTLDEAFKNLIARYARASVSAGAAYIDPANLGGTQEKAEHRARDRKISIKIAAGLSVIKYGSTVLVDTRKKPSFVPKTPPELIPFEDYPAAPLPKLPSNSVVITGKPDAWASYERYSDPDFSIFEKRDEFNRATFWIYHKTSPDAPELLIHSSAVTQLPSIETPEGKFFDRKFSEPQAKERARIVFKFAGLFHFNYFKDGVESGDRALLLFASVLEKNIRPAIEEAIKNELKSHLRPVDLLFSGMGSDFVLFLQDVPIEIALKIRHRLLDTVANSPEIHSLIQKELAQLENDPEKAPLVPQLREALDPKNLIESKDEQFKHFLSHP